MPLFRTQKRFFRAVEQGQADIVADYLNVSKTWVDLVDENGETALYKAAAHGHLDLVKLLSRFKNFERTARSATPLHVAAQNGHVNIVKELLSKGWDAYINLSGQTNHADRDWSHQLTPLQYAIHGNHADILKALLETGKADLVSAGGRPVLYYAVECGSLVCVQLLLTKGADPNIAYEESKYGTYGGGAISSKTPPLYCAVSNNATLIALRLLDAGAKPEAPFMSNDRSYYPLHSAAQNDNLEIVTALIARGVDVNKRNAEGQTPLHIAAQKGSISIARFLLSRGAKSDIEDKQGHKPVFYAQQFALEEMINLLKGPPALLPVEVQPVAPPSAAAKAPLEIWKRLGQDEIAHIIFYPELNRRMTDIFNFKSRERVLINENVALSRESTAPHEGFDGLPNEVLETALNEFKRQGGVADEAAVFKYRIIKKKA